MNHIFLVCLKLCPVCTSSLLATSEYFKIVFEIGFGCFNNVENIWHAFLHPSFFFHIFIIIIVIVMICSRCFGCAGTAFGNIVIAQQPTQILMCLTLCVSIYDFCRDFTFPSRSYIALLNAE